MGMVMRVSQSGQRASDRPMYRLAGWAAVVAGVTFLVQPLSVALLPFNLEEQRDPVTLSSHWWAGSLQAVEFTVIAGAVITLVCALRKLGPATSWRRVAWVLGVLSGACFMLQAALSAATYSWWLMQDASAITPDPEIRSAILFSTFVAGYTFLGAANVCTAGWLLGVMYALRQAEIAKTVFAVFAVAIAALLVTGTLTGFAIPTVVLHLPVWLVLGAKLLRSSRAAGDAAVGR